MLEILLCFVWALSMETECRVLALESIGALIWHDSEPKKEVFMKDFEVKTNLPDLVLFGWSREPSLSEVVDSSETIVRESLSKTVGTVETTL